MNSIDNHYLIGIEELTLAVSMAGSPEIAKGLLTTNFGLLNPENESGRLLAAGHSLMARNLLFLDGEKPKLEKEFSKLVKSIIDNEYSLRFGIGSGETEKLLTCHIQKEKLVIDRIHRGVVHELWYAKDFKEIAAVVIDFFGLVSFDISGYTPVDVPQTFLEDQSVNKNITLSELSNHFKSFGMPDPFCNLFAEDYKYKVFRGNGVRFDLVNGKVEVKRGFLILKGKQRAWLLKLLSNDEKPTYRIFLAIPEIVEREVMELK